MNDALRARLVSALTTFVTVFIVTLGAQVQLAGTVEFTFAFWASLIVAASRVALKEVAAGFITLGKKLGQKN
jgi:hypothetical protein